MNKIFNYQKNGPGVSKAAARTGRTGGFWRIYKEKFFQLLGLNLLFCLCLAIVIGISFIPLKYVNNSRSEFSVVLKENYDIDSSLVSAFDRMVDAYKIDDAQLDKASVHFVKALDLIKSKDKSALAKHDLDGVLTQFKSTKFTQDELDLIASEITAGLKVLGFTVKHSDGVDFTDYKLCDKSGNEVAKLNVTYTDKGKIDKFAFAHYFPHSVSRVAMVFLCFMPVILLGPIKLGITRITRDYVREEPTFMMSDLWDTIKKNWWQSFVISFIEYIATGCALLSLLWYYTYINSGIFFIIGFAGCLFLSYIFISMHFYVPVMQVTLDLKLRKIYKNAFFFTVISMLRNVGMILLGALLIIAAFLLLFVFGQVHPLVLSLTVTLILMTGFSFWFYFVSYNTYPSIKKYVIDPYYEAQNESDDESQDSASDEEAPASSDEDSIDTEGSNEETDGLPEYVYHNGRMVHRSVLEQQNVFDDDVT